jgi:hypothetical protein
LTTESAVLGDGRNPGLGRAELEAAFAAQLGAREVVWLDGADGGRLECLMWLREYGCPWAERTCIFADAQDFREVLQCARDNGCPE